MKIKILLRHGEYVDVEFEDAPMHIPMEVEIVEASDEEEWRTHTIIFLIVKIVVKSLQKNYTDAYTLQENDWSTIKKEVYC